MSLVITAWDTSLGIAVCEGRAITKVHGNKIPVREDQTKLSRLADGSILGLTGGLRDGYDSTTMRESLVTDPLRRDIHAEAETHTFREMRFVIPRLLAEYAVKYPELGFGVSLLGNDGGKVRGAAWSSNGAVYDPADTPGVRASILGCNEAVNREATEAVRKVTANQSILPFGMHIALENIIKNLARRHVELNDHISVEFVSACAGADGFCLNTLEPREAGSDQTANHTAASIYHFPSSTVSVPVNGSVTVASVTISSAGPNDVFLLFWSLLSSNSTNVQVQVDGVGGWQYCSNQKPTGQAAFGYVTGLAAGPHTVSVIGSAGEYGDTYLESGCSLLTMQISGAGGGFVSAPVGGQLMSRPALN